jgi:ribulose-phosphate 3-epimerase
MTWRDWVRDVEVEPSLYAADFLRLGEQLEQLLEAGALVVHVDIGDGHFIPPVTIGPVVVEAVAPLVHACGGRIDCHLMVEEPERHFEQVAAAGGDSVTFHVEACRDVPAAVERARRLGLGVGLALSPETPVEHAADHAAAVDLVLCMSVHPGYSGQAFLPAALERLERLRDLTRGTLLQVDGGVGVENAAAVRAAGARLLVAGSSVFGGPDVGSAYREIVRAAA